MTTEFSHSVELAASPARVVEVFTDRAAATARYAAAGFVRVQVGAATPSGDMLIQTSERTDVTSLPGPLARVTKGAVVVTERDDWGPPAADGARTATWRLDVRGVPVSVGGTIEVRPTPTGTRLTQTGTIDARIPVVGKRLEGMSIGHTIATLDKEWAWLAAHL